MALGERTGLPLQPSELGAWCVFGILPCSATIELEIAPGVYTTWIRAAVREIVPVTDEEVYEDAEYEEAEYTDEEYNELSGQDAIEPIHDHDVVSIGRPMRRRSPAV